MSEAFSFLITLPELVAVGLLEWWGSGEGWGQGFLGCAMVNVTFLLNVCDIGMCSMALSEVCQDNKQWMRKFYSRQELFNCVLGTTPEALNKGAVSHIPHFRYIVLQKCFHKRFDRIELFSSGSKAKHICPECQIWWSYRLGFGADKCFYLVASFCNDCKDQWYCRVVAI